MSGGRFDYKDFTLKDEIFGYSDKCTNVFEDKEISQLVWDVLNLIHEFDWYKSGDTDEKDYLKAKIEFKNKWLSNNQGERTKEIIDKTIEEAKQELYKTFLNYQILGADFAEKQKHETINSALTAGPTIDCTTATISVNNDWQIVKDISNASDIVYKDKSLNELIEDILNRLDRLERRND